MNALIGFFVSFFSGYTFFNYFTHPEKKKHVVPHLKFKNIEILPNLRIHYRRTTIHIHHWLLFAAVTLSSFFFADGILSFLVVKGVALGGIVQGLRFKDRFRFRYPRHNEISK